MILSIRSRGIKTTAVRAFSKVKRKLLGKRYYEQIFYNDSIIHLAFYPTGGLGDYIISKSVLEEILEMADCKVTVFCDKPAFAKAIYRDVASEIKAYEVYDSEFYKYDLALNVEHFIHVDSFKEKKLCVLSQELAKRISYICDNWDKLYVDIDRQCWRERIQFERCRISRLDRWTELRMGKAFDIASKKVSIPMDKDAKSKWDKNLGNIRYITINYGADAMVPGKKQLKLWNKEYYEELIKLIHAADMNIEIVQLGGKDSEKIKGVDRYIFGESIEYAKYVLKGSLCHIDCEGGLVHLATQFGTKCIVIFGPTPKHMYAYEQNINLVNEECNGCMGLHEDWAYECYMGYKMAECINSIRAKRVLEELEKVIHENVKMLNK